MTASEIVIKLVRAAHRSPRIWKLVERKCVDSWGERLGQQLYSALKAGEPATPATIKRHTAK